MNDASEGGAARDPGAAIKVLIIDRHQLLVDSLSQWLAVNAPDIAVLAEWNGARAKGALANSARADHTRGDGDAEADVAVVSDVRAVAPMRGAGIQVVLLAEHLRVVELASALQAGALGIVPKSAEPADAASAIRAAASGLRYLHHDVEALLASAGARSVELSRREQRLVELYLGPIPRSTRDVAEELGISEQTVKSHLHRVRQRYAAAGFKVSNVISLQDQLRKDGWLD
ncbi:sigma factor-like helix-turn-helix DNA-binding protein [bacterium RCC_150]